MSELSHFTALVRLTLQDPIAAGRAVLALAPTLEQRWILLALASVVAALLAGVAMLLTAPAEFAPLVPGAIIQMGMSLLLVVVVYQVGRLFGGQGGFSDTLLVVGWLQVVMVIVQLPYLVAVVALPALTGVGMLIAVGGFFWVFPGLVCALHGFESRGKVLFGALGTVFVLSFVLLVLLRSLGIEMPGMNDV
jgi:hypothetical protein